MLTPQYEQNLEKINNKKAKSIEVGNCTNIKQIFEGRVNRFGDIIILQGLFIADNNSFASNTNYKICTLPEWARPNFAIRSVQGRIIANWDNPGNMEESTFVTITTNGEVYFNYGSRTNINTTMLQITYPVP